NCQRASAPLEKTEQGSDTVSDPVSDPFRSEQTGAADRLSFNGSHPGDTTGPPARPKKQGLDLRCRVVHSAGRWRDGINLQPDRCVSAAAFAGARHRPRRPTDVG